LFFGGGFADYEAGPGAYVDAVVAGQFPALAGGDGIFGEGVGGLAYEGAVGGLEVFHPPALAVGGELRLAAAYSGVVAAVDLGGDAAALRGAADQDALGGDRDDYREAW
jgi:hypothetical protein